MSSNAGETFRCPSCDCSFSCSKWDNPRIPLLLQCSHSICKSCAKLQEERLPGQVRCAKCHEQTLIDVDQELPKNFYLIGLLQDLWQQTLDEPSPSIDLTKQCECGKAVSTLCYHCNVLLCLPCFEETHKTGYLRRHKFIDPGQEKAKANIQELRAKAKSSDNEAKNTRHLPELKKLKDSLSVGLRENLLVYKTFENHCDEYKKQCDDACREVDLKIADLIALLQNLSQERKTELYSALKKYLNRLDQERWLEDINNLKAAVNSIEDILNNNHQDLDYKEFIGLLRKYVSTEVRKFNTPPAGTNLFSVEIDSEMEPRKIKKRIKVLAKLPAENALQTYDRENWMSFSKKELKLPTPQTKKTSENLCSSSSSKPLKKSEDSGKSSTQQTSSVQPIEKPQDSGPPLSYKMSSVKPALNPKSKYSIRKPADDSSSSSCFSDEEDLKAARKANKKKSSASDNNIQIILKKSDLSMVSQIDESMLSRVANPRPATTTRGSCKPSYSNYTNKNTKLKSEESQVKKFEIPNKDLMQFQFYDAQIITFSSFDEFYVQLVEPEYMAESNQIVKELISYFSNPGNIKECLWAHVNFFGVCKFGETWHRCTVVKVLPEHYEIVLIDLGRKLKILKCDLKNMPTFLTKRAKVAVKCKLADIKTNSSYSEKAIKAFKKLAMTTNGKMSILVTEKTSPSESGAIPVAVYIQPNNGLKINLNAYLAERFDCVKSTGQESVGVISKDDTAGPLKKSQMIQDCSALAKAGSKKLEVEILSTESPGEFFASFKNPEHDFENTYLCIQNDAVTASSFHLMKGSTKKNWRVGDYCYLKLSLDTMDPKWYRGCIATLDRSTEKSAVFLIDKGISITINSDQLIGASNYVPPEFPAAATKMHLADAIPIGGSDTWNLSSKQMFKKIVQSFNNFCVSDVGEKNSLGSLPVKLWGVTIAYGSILSQQQEFHDIGAYLFNEGYVDLNSKQSKTESSQSAPAEIIHDVNIPHPIDAWKPAAPAQVGEFQGIPTEVDDDGVIYIQTRDQHALFNELKVNLTTEYLVYHPERMGEDLKLGQAVIVHQKVTGEYHRGIIEKINRNGSFKVRLVDTGTLENVVRRDIYTNVVAADTPILCQKFRLSSVLPTNATICAWPAETLEFIHGQIVDKAVKVAVTEVGDISSCSIIIVDKYQEIETILVDSGMARWRKPDEAWPSIHHSDKEDEVDVFRMDHKAMMQEKIREERFDQFANAMIQPATVEVSPEHTKRYLRACNEDSNKEISESVVSLGSLKSTSSSRKNASVTTDRMSNAFETVKINKKPRKRYAVRPAKHIQFFDLQAAEIKRFRCTFLSVHNKTKLYVNPQIDELQQTIENLDNALESLNGTMLTKFRHIQDAVNENCLVKIEQNWNRALITSVSADDSLVDVFLLDSAKCTTVGVKNVYKMDLKLYKFPKKTLIVVLDGYKFSSRLEDQDIEKLVASTLKNKSLKAVVKSHDDKNFPVVELKDDSDCLAYQSLIDNKFLI